MEQQALSRYETMAKLRLSDSEREAVSAALATIADSAGALSRIDTEGVEPLVSVLDLHNVLREDVAAKVISREELLSGAPEEYNGYFQVPKTLD